LLKEFPGKELEQAKSSNQ